jgi:hypothetical protein
MDRPWELVGQGSVSLGKLFRLARRQSRNLLARLRSIAVDSAWVRASLSTGAISTSLPVFANLRAGAWYTASPQHAYFKSTDGHYHTAAFSRTRLNLHLARAAAAAGGAVLVDATASGKRFPDSFITVAIWATVFNAVACGEGAPPLAAFFPPWQPASVRDAAGRVAATAAAALPAELRAAVAGALLPGGAPLWPVFACQPPSGTVGAPWEGALAAARARGALPLLCVSASRAPPPGGDEGAEHAGWRYMQGAGDDAEAWAGRLTPALLHAHLPALLASGSSEAAAAAVDALAGAGAGGGAGGASGGAGGGGAGAGWLGPSPSSAAALLRALAAGAAPVPAVPAALGEGVLLVGPAALQAAAAAAAAAALPVGEGGGTGASLGGGNCGGGGGGDGGAGVGERPPPALIVVVLPQEGGPPPPLGEAWAAAGGGGGGDAPWAPLPFSAPGAPPALLLFLPASKKAHRACKEAWQDAIFPGLEAAVLAARRGGGEVWVAFCAAPGAAAAAAAVAAGAALCPLRGGAAAGACGALDKQRISTAVSLSAAACSAAVGRELLKQLHRWLLGERAPEVLSR